MLPIMNLTTQGLGNSSATGPVVPVSRGSTCGSSVALIHRRWYPVKLIANELLRLAGGRLGALPHTVRPALGSVGFARAMLRLGHFPTRPRSFQDLLIRPSV